MICADCGGEVVWVGPITNLSHTECKQCGSVNNYLTEKVEDDVVCEVNSTQLEADGEFVSFAGTDDVICSVASGSYENDDKLAMLFAAAPELLQALQLIINYHDDGYVGLHHEDLALARKAIAKATGTKG
ncbi:hypothetical protein AB6G46_10860 [Providencia hangzhouensis]|uniref:hypothetical protein n=1 Tax=Providencia hangzhouensis TaxID=3031799 RepID=UPI0034DD3A2B